MITLDITVTIISIHCPGHRTHVGHLYRILMHPVCQGVFDIVPNYCLIAVCVLELVAPTWTHPSHHNDLINAQVVQYGARVNLLKRPRSSDRLIAEYLQADYNLGQD